MDAPESLAPRLYLLACDLQRDRLVNRDQLGLTLRAAALDDLLTHGLLTDENGKPAVARSGPTTADRLQDDLLAAVEAEKPRAWKWWVSRRGGAAVDAVGEQLADADLIRHSTGRTLLVFPARQVEVLHPEIAEDLRRKAIAILKDDLPMDRIDRRDAAMTSLAAEGQLRTVFSGAERRRHRARLRELREHVGPAAAALRKALSERQAAIASSGGGG
ncbi:MULTISPECIES: GOLPH3/VPS74 family protein [Actinoalloteichus]|uniref:Golgi phosphoprotein 3 (GPP34) n=1 Tax=Actinoalloteichus fjordicus TaxID=1612552 RepID=A0AAC9LF13_9PSEU|nr:MULTISPECIES: GPP34 family phosphoprotein [Actinoalloteichus]APU16648.1 Golgi phosphoprotein 3 (GPP34) [Actinoalloteichus fjordicus]APU22714.1 Golgi phosphoprotein 3 (GPP34) [Actinoalloteichus sp. GBA129-24]